jgi:hypothetical protein
MPMNFPDTPTNGSSFTSAGSTWTWNGTAWKPATAASGSPPLFLPLAGGTMTGNLTLAAAPSANLQAATKAYVDARWVQMTQAAYTALPTKDPTVLYVIVG